MISDSLELDRDGLLGKGCEAQEALEEVADRALGAAVVLEILAADDGARTIIHIGADLVDLYHAAVGDLLHQLKERHLVGCCCCCGCGCSISMSERDTERDIERYQDVR